MISRTLCWFAPCLGTAMVFGAAPSVTTYNPTQISPTTVMLQGAVNPFSEAAGAWFEWGPTTNYGNATAITNLPAAFTFYSVATQLVALTPDATYHYRIVATNSAGPTFGLDVSFATLPAPIFVEVSNSFRGSFAGTATFADYDNDGRMDLLLTGTTNSFSAAAQFTRLYRNTSTNFLEINPGLPGLIGGSTVWADYDRDGWLDFFIIGRNTNTLPFSALMRNRADGTFTNVAAALPSAQDTAAVWGDFDNDGDPDLFITGEPAANQFLAKVYGNSGGIFSLTPSQLQQVQNGSAAWGDYDNDGDLDLVVVGDNKNYPLNSSANLFATLYRNDSGTLTNSGISLPGMNGATVSWLDFDNDGDLDLFMLGATNVNGGGPTNYVMLVYRNDGGQFTALNLGFPDAGLSSFVWADFNNDGWSDLLITGLGATPLLSGLYFGNSNGVFTAVTNSGLARLFAGGAAVADIDDDGRLDVLITGLTNTPNAVTRLFRNITPLTNTPPSVPTNLTVEVASDGRSAILRWSASTDAQTPSAGLTYNVRTGTTPGAANLLSPQADLVTGRLRIAQMGNAQHRRSLRLTGLTPGVPYYWSVQAVDNGFAASRFASESSFNAIGPANFVGMTRTNDNIVFTCRGTPGVTYTILATDNLVQPVTNGWAVFTNGTADDSGTFQFTANRTLAPQRFFRTAY